MKKTLIGALAAILMACGPMFIPGGDAGVGTDVDAGVDAGPGDAGSCQLQSCFVSPWLPRGLKCCEGKADGQGGLLEAPADGIYKGSATRMTVEGSMTSPGCTLSPVFEVEFRNGEPVAIVAELTGTLAVVSGSGLQFSTSSMGCMNTTNTCRNVALGYDLVIANPGKLSGTIRVNLISSDVASDVCKATYSIVMEKQ